MSRPVLLLCGGIGRHEALYRACAESVGYDLEYAERKISGTPPRVARVVVFVSVCSHPLREAAERLALAQRVPIQYARQPSVSALRRVLGEEGACVPA